MKIYLIGMPLSGKTTLGKALANALELSFIDLDELIEVNSFMFIDEIFMLHGEEYFRALETRMLEKIAKLDNCVIATGGGIVCEKNNLALMNGLKVHLDVDLDILNSRNENSDSIRPLLKDFTLDELFIKRQNLYQTFSDITLKNPDLEMIIRSVKDAYTSS